MTTDSFIIKAYAMAADHHRDAKRKFSNRPYILHPIRVAGRVAIMPAVTQYEIAAAILHDCVEDFPFMALDKIEAELHPKVATYVGNLTNPSKKFMLDNGRYAKDFPRERRKEMDRKHLAEQDEWTQTIKCIDRDDNVCELLADLQSSLWKRPPLDFIYLYCDESVLLNEVLTKAPQHLRDELKRNISLLKSVAGHTR